MILPVIAIITVLSVYIGSRWLEWLKDGFYEYNY